MSAERGRERQALALACQLGNGVLWLGCGLTVAMVVWLGHRAGLLWF